MGGRMVEKCLNYTVLVLFNWNVINSQAYIYIEGLWRNRKVLAGNWSPQLPYFQMREARAINTVTIWGHPVSIYIWIDKYIQTKNLHIWEINSIYIINFIYIFVWLSVFWFSHQTTWIETMVGRWHFRYERTIKASEICIFSDFPFCKFNMPNDLATEFLLLWSFRGGAWWRQQRGGEGMGGDDETDIYYNMHIHTAENERKSRGTVKMIHFRV